MKKKFDPVLEDWGRKVQTSNLKNSVMGKIVFVRNYQNMPYSAVQTEPISGLGILRAFDEKIDKLAIAACDCLVLPEICTVN